MSLDDSIVVPPSARELQSVRGILNKISLAKTKRRLPPSASLFLTRPIPCALPDQIPPLTSHHWVSWHVCGYECLFIQIKPLKKRLPAADVDSSPDDDESDSNGDEEPSAAVAKPSIFIVPCDGGVFKVKPEHSVYFARTTAGCEMYSTIVLEGCLGLRAVVANSIASFEYAQSESLRTLLEACSYANTHREPLKWIFFASSCIWSRIYRGNEDFQYRAQLARSLIDFDMGVLVHNENTRCSASSSSLVVPASSPCFGVVFKPFMSPSASHICVRDVPRVLFGCQLNGVEFRLSNARHAFDGADDEPSCDFWTFGSGVRDLVEAHCSIHGYSSAVAFNQK